MRLTPVFPITLIALFSLFSCSTGTIKRHRTETRNHDLFRSESFYRMNEKRLELELARPKQKYGPVITCHKGKTKKGLDSLKLDLKNGKKDPLYWIHVGNCHLLKNNDIKAEFFYRLAIQTASKKHRKKSPALNNLGVIFHKNGHIKKALKFFKEAHEANKKLITPGYNLAQIYLQYGYTDKALYLLERMKKNHPDAVELLFSLGAAWLIKGNTKKALSYFNKIKEPYSKREDIAVWKNKVPQGGI
ncbi:MAG: tetratricopeptide repeat protein [Bacteriovoracaceae bacterium]|nr:tetratricopeptide repeat protein [Bacteriovoracaceae bacterium]